MATRFRLFVRSVTSALHMFRSVFDGPTVRALAPGIMPLALAPFLVASLRLLLNEPLFGDTLVFQYTGWCIRHGMKLYRDVGMADGPFIHYLHAAIQLFVGIADRSFRKGDLVLQTGGSAIIGALLAPASYPKLNARVASRVTWAAVAAALWLSGYVDLSWNDTTERETYYALFASVGMVLLFASDGWERRLALAGLFAGAFLTTLQVFGKPTGVVYPAMGLLGIALPSPGSRVPWRTRVATFFAGAGASTLSVLIALLLTGSVSGYFFWCWKIPYVGNRFLFRHDWLPLFLVQAGTFRTTAAISLLAGIGAIACGWLPLRALGFALVPSILFLGACLQGRGYTYQFVPVTEAFEVLLLIGLSSLWGRTEGGEGSRDRPLVAAVAFTFVGYLAFQNVETSATRWDGDKTRWHTPFHEFATEERQVGTYIKDHTQPSDRVFAYSAGENAHVVLLFAERRTASPFFHTFWLDPVDLIPQSDIKPTPGELSALTNLQTEIQRVACSAVERNKPAAVALNFFEQAFKVCPNIKDLLNEQYREDARIGSFHVFLRKSSHAEIDDLAKHP